MDDSQWNLQYYQYRDEPQYHDPELHHHHHQQQESLTSSLLDSNGAGFSSGTEPNNFTHKLCIENIPLGFRFRPTDVELIRCYLKFKIERKYLPSNKIHEVNLYKYHPETLAGKFEQCEENEWYFFTPRDKKYKNGTRPSRSCKDGYWKATGVDKSITDNGQKIGSKKSLVFYNGKLPKGVKTNWIMHEYKLQGPPRVREHENDMKLDDFVLCKIYKRKVKSEEDPRDGEPEDQDQSHGLHFINHDHGETRPQYFQQQEIDALLFDHDSTVLHSGNAFTYNETTSEYQQLSSTGEVRMNMMQTHLSPPPNQMMQSHLSPPPNQMMHTHLSPPPDLMMQSHLSPPPDLMMQSYLSLPPSLMMQSVPTYASPSLNHHFLNDQQQFNPSHLQSLLLEEDGFPDELIASFLTPIGQTFGDFDPKAFL